MERILLPKARAEAGDEADRITALLQPVSGIDRTKLKNEATIKKTIYWIVLRSGRAWLYCYSRGM